MYVCACDHKDILEGGLMTAPGSAAGIMTVAPWPGRTIQHQQREG